MAKANIDINLSNGKQAGSTINELRQQANRLNKEINQLKPGSDEFVKKSRDFNQVTGRLKEVRNEVKNTKASNDKLVDSFSQFVPFSGQIRSVGQALKGVNLGLKGTRAALIATGVGAFLILLGSLVSYLTSVQAGMDKVTAVTRPLAAVFQTLKGVVQELGGSVFNGLAMILNGDIKEGLKALGNGFVDVIDNTKTAIKEGIEAGTELDKLQKQIEKTEIELTVKRAQLNKVYNESKEIAQDLSRSEAERSAAAREAIKAQDELLNMEQTFIDLKIEKMKLEHSLNDTSREDQLELAQLEAERIDFEAQAAKKRASAKSLENTANKTADAEAAKNRNAALKEEEERLKELETQKEQARARELQAEKNLQDLRIQLMEEGLQREVEKLWLDTDRKIEALTGTEEQITAQKVALEKLRLKEIEALTDEYLASEKEKKDAALAQDKERQAASSQTALATANSTIGAMGGIFGNLAGMQEEGSRSYKDFATAQAYMAAGQAALNAYQSTAAIPVVGPALAPIAAAAALAFGIKQADSIKKQKIGSPSGGGSIASSAPSIGRSSIGNSTNATASTRGINFGAGATAAPAVSSNNTQVSSASVANNINNDNGKDTTADLINAFENRITNIKVVNNLQDTNEGIKILNNVENDSNL